MLPKPTACRGCPFESIGIGFAPPVGPPDAHLRLLGEALGEDEVEEGAPFVGKTGGELDVLLKTAGIERAGIWIGNTIQCRPPGNNYKLVPKEAVEHCQAAHVPPPPLGSVEILMGAPALHLRLRGSHSIQAWRGSVVPTETGIAIPTLHPAFLFRGQWKCRGLVVQDLKAAREIQQEIQSALPRGAVGERSEPVPASCATSCAASCSPASCAPDAPASCAWSCARSRVHPPSLVDEIDPGRWLALDGEAQPDHSLDILGLTTDGQRVMQVDEGGLGRADRLIREAEVVLIHNGPYDKRLLARAGLEIPQRKIVDTLLTQTMLRSDLEVGLNDSVAAMLSGRWAYHKALWGFRKDGREKETQACRTVWEKITGLDLGVDKLRYLFYNALDVASTWRLWQRQLAEI